MVSLPTLVPSARADGSCRYYEESRCTIHAVSPFGCAFVDAHMSEAEFTRRTNIEYRELLNDHATGGKYARLTAELKALGRVAPPVALRQARLREAMRKEGM